MVISHGTFNLAPLYNQWMVTIVQFLGFYVSSWKKLRILDFLESFLMFYHWKSSKIYIIIWIINNTILFATNIPGNSGEIQAHLYCWWSHSEQYPRCSMASPHPLGDHIPWRSSWWYVWTHFGRFSKWCWGECSLSGQKIARMSHNSTIWVCYIFNKFDWND